MNTTTLPAGAEAPAATGPRPGLAALTLGAIGIVYGDIGTSPLYTMKEVFAPATGVPLDAAHLVGAVSAIFWALMLVVTLKYVLLVLRADNRGEGGVLALAALAAQTARGARRHALLLLGMAGATLFYGDSIITPAISVLGAMEGLEVVTPALKPAVLPLALAGLLGLFLFQRHGTAVVGRFFGPVIVLWFVVLGVAGVVQIAQQPAILAALDPRQAFHFLAARGWMVFAAVGALVLALTGAEALYADLGHFGRKPIRLAWTGLVLPSLALNYLGQGALLMRDPSAIENPFFRLFPEHLLVPAVLLATLAAIIASQAVISGAYSLTRQAIQLGFLPRMSLRHTSAHEAGQIYMPAVNWTLLAGVVAAVLAFGSSSSLAGAYGIAVTLTMAVTTLLTYVVVRHHWRLPAPVAAGATLFFLALDALLIAGCAVKFFDGGWFPLALGAALFVVMSTWLRGRERLMQALREEGLALAPFLGQLADHPPPRVERTAVYLVGEADTVPQALLHNLKHNGVLHAQNLLLTLAFHDQPWIDEADRVHAEALGHGFWRVTLNYGFMDTPDVPRAWPLCARQGLVVPPFETSYFLSRQTLVPDAMAGTNAAGSGFARWRRQLFAAMSRQASGAAAYFRLPDNAVVELGTRVAL